MSREMKDSGVEWIGEIPEGWNVCKIDSLYYPRSTKVSDKDYLPLSVTMKGIVPQLSSTAKTDDHDNRKLVKKGDFAINSRSDRRGSCGISEYDGSVSLINTVLQPRHGMNNEYYNWLFHSDMFSSEFYRLGHGIVDDLRTTSWQEMKKMVIPAPSPTEQQQIVHFLDRKCTAIDTAIEKTKKSIEKLEEYKKAVITKAVTKGIDPNAKMKDSGVEWIGEIPENWDVIKLKYLLKDSMKYGATETGIEYSEELPRYIRITDITPDNKLKDSGKLSLTEQQAEKYLLKEDTILFARSGATVGKTFLYKTEYGRAAFAGYMISAIPNNDKLLATWLYYYTLSFSYEDWVNRSFLQATIQNIGADKYSNLLISLPCINKQSEIVKYLDGKCAMFDAAIKKKKKAIEKWEEYKKSLIYYAVTGKIDCRNEVI